MLQHRWDILVLFSAVIIGFWAFKPSSPNTKYSYAQVTTIESIIAGGLGRSRMFTTYGDGRVDEVNMENLYSMVGLNLKNINSNDKMIVAKLNEMSNNGWELTDVNVGVESPTDGGKSGIYMTRYLFRKSAD